MNIVNDIKTLTKDDYLLVIREFIDKFSGKSKVSLYMFGNIKHPSISDLDLVIVYQNDLKESEIYEIVKKAYEFTRENGLKRYLFTHSILIYPEKVFRNIEYIHTLYNPSLLWGKEVYFTEISEKEKEVLSQVHFINFTYSTLLNLKKMDKKKSIPLRKLLLLLNSVKHSLKYLYENGYGNLDIRSNLNILENVRENFDIVKFINIQDLERLISSSLRSFLENFLKKRVIYKDFSKLLQKNIKLFYLQEKKPVTVPGIVLLHGAMYHKYCKYKNSKYRIIHELQYPIWNFDVSDKIYKSIIFKQTELMKILEENFYKFHINPLVPFMCKYCPPTLSMKQKLRLSLNKILIKLQI